MSISDLSRPSYVLSRLEILLTKQGRGEWRQLFKDPPKPPPDSDSDSSDEGMSLACGKRSGMRSGLRRALRMPKLRRPKPLFFFDQPKKEVILPFMQVGVRGEGKGGEVGSKEGVQGREGQERRGQGCSCLNIPADWPSPKADASCTDEHCRRGVR